MRTRENGLRQFPLVVALRGLHGCSSPVAFQHGLPKSVPNVRIKFARIGAQVKGWRWFGLFGVEHCLAGSGTDTEESKSAVIGPS